MSLARKEKRVTVEEYFDLQRNTGKRSDQLVFPKLVIGIRLEDIYQGINLIAEEK